MGAGDVLYMTAELFGAALIIGISFFLFTTLNDSPIGTDFSQQIVDGWSVFDTVFILMTVALAVSAIMLAYYVPTSPAFILVMVIEILMVLIIVPAFSNVYAVVAGQPELSNSFDAFTNIAWIMGNLPLISLVIAGGIALAQYGKNPQGQLQGL